MSGNEQAQAGGESTPEWRGPHGILLHDNIDYALENVTNNGGQIPDTVHMSTSDKGVVLGAAAILGVEVPEATRRLGGRQERKAAGLNGKPSGDRRRDQIWLPNADDVARNLELGETASGLIVAARIIESHKPKPLAPTRPIRTLGARALGGLTDLHDPYKDQIRLREVVNGIIVDAYGKSQNYGLCLNGEPGTSFSIPSPLLWARAVELTGGRGSQDPVLNAKIQRGFEEAYAGHRQYHEGYPAQAKALYEDIQKARLGAQLDNYDLLHRILVRMRTDEERPNLAQAAYAEGVTLTRENYRQVLTQLDNELTYLRQILGLMNKDGMNVEQAVQRLRRPVRPIPGSVRVHIAESHAEREQKRRNWQREVKARAAAEKVAEQELKRHRGEVVQTSARDYNRAVIADPIWNAERAREAVDNGDLDIATTHAMALAEQERFGLRGAAQEFQRLWAEIAPRLIQHALANTEDVRRGVVSVGEMQLIERLDPSTIRDDKVTEAIVQLKEALNEAAFAHYGFGTIYGPKDPTEPMDLSGDKPENAVPMEYGGIYRPDDASAVKAGFIYERLTASGTPRVRDASQLDLHELITHTWSSALLEAAEGSDPRALPRRLNALLADVNTQLSELGKGQRMQRIKDFWHLVVDPLKNG